MKKKKEKETSFLTVKLVIEKINVKEFRANIIYKLIETIKIMLTVII